MKNRNVIDAFKNAFNGLVILSAENSARREIAISVTALILFIVDNNAFTLVLFVLSILLLAFECLNTAIEEICNYLTHDFDPRIKRIKDVASGAILLTATAMGLVFMIYLARKLS